MIKTTIAVLLFCCFSTAAIAQKSRVLGTERTRFDQLTVADGLPENSVRVILQDHLGFLWLGTQNGLVRYDGNSMTVFRYSANDPHSLKGRNIAALMEDRNGDIWIGAESLFRFERATRRFIEYPNKNFQLVPNGSVQFIHEDKQGDIWAMAVEFDNNAVTLERLNPKTKVWTSFRHDPADPAGFASRGVHGIFYQFDLLEAKNGKIWLTTRGDKENALHWFDRKTDRFVRYKFNAPSPAMAEDLKGVSGIAFDNAGNLFLSSFWTGKGLFHLNLQTGEVRQWKHDPKKPNSLLSNFTARVYQDRFGFVWVPTDKGIDRFDPKTNVFAHYIPKPGDLNMQGYYWMHGLTEDPDGNLWCIFFGGLNFYDRKTDRFIRHENDVKLENSFDSLFYVNDVFIDRKGLVWLGAFYTGLFKENRASRFHLIKSDPNNTNSLQSAAVFAIYETPSEPGVIWFGTETGLDRFDKKTGKFTHYRHDKRNEKSLGEGMVSSMVEDKKGRFWVATRGGGLNLMDRKTGAFTHYKHDPKNPNSLQEDFLNSLKLGSDGKLWMGGDGLNRFDVDNNHFTRFLKADTTYTPALFGLLLRLNTPGRTVAAIARPGEKVDTTVGFSLAQTTELLITGLGEISNGRLVDYGWVEDAAGKIVWEMTFTNCLSDGLEIARVQTGIVRLDAGAYRLRYKSDEGYSYGNWNSFPPSHPELWGIRISRVNAPEAESFKIEAAKRYFNGLSDNNIFSITEDSKKNIWLGTNSRGVTKYDPRTEKFVSFFDALKGPLCVTGSVVEVGETGSFWVGDEFMGLLLLNEKGEILQQYDVSNGLPSNAVLGVQPDEKGILWVGTDNGLCRFDPATGQIQRYNESHGLQGLKFNQNAFFRTADGEIYFGGPNGVNAFYPGQIKLDTLAPPVALTELDISGKPATLGEGGQLPVHISIAQKITLPYNQNDLTFHFTALQFERGSDCRFAYKLSPKDKDWVQAGSLRQIRYADLSQGTYVFSVKAANADGVWNEKGVSVTVVILPPWWKTVWAYLFYGLCLIAGLFYIDRFQRKRIAERERAKTRERELAQAKEIEKAYTELGAAHEHLKATQSQLIQSEKLASLGELTAGIAHEIQNPLNFVNNFAELSVDLAEELKLEIGKLEIPAQDKEYVGEILGDLTQNQQKINHHGKRAASIVTGMLQHARTSSGKKEPTDLNALADEYLRLSYHGLRAKDSSFNAKMVTDFDPAVGKVEVVPQDIGRVFLNLVNNAFYATQQKKRQLSESSQLSESYEPTVSVSSKRTDSGVEFRIKDNGTGIPAEVKAKIFQPFFTTKPTGQGTGLGLSLAYDIVTKGHGGTLEVESTEGEGTVFTIQLPSPVKP